MKYKLLKKITAVLLSIALIFTGVSIEAFHSSVNSGKKVAAVRVEAKEKKKKNEPKIVKELKKLQTANSSTYLLSNGAKRVEYYSNNIRYKKDGKYVAYNPRLKNISYKERKQLKEQVASCKAAYKKDIEEYIYTNTSGDAKQYFPKDLGDTGVLLHKDKYMIGFLLQMGEDEQLKDDKESDIQIQKTEGEEILYRDESSDIEYRYISNYDGVKEEIILKQCPESNAFSFDIQADGLELEKTEYDKTIRIRDIKTGKQIAYIDEPNIRDKTEKISYSEVN